MHHLLFPSLIFSSDHTFSDEKIKKLIDKIYQYQKKDFGTIISNVGGWHSTPNPAEFYDYIDIIMKQLDLFCQFQLSNFWININPPGSFNQEHDHPNADLSGVFWVQSSDNCGDLIFKNPSAFVQSKLIGSCPENLKKQYKIYNEMNYTPQEKKSVVFPAHLSHKVGINQSDKDRISISFNLNLRYN